MPFHTTSNLARRKAPEVALFQANLCCTVPAPPPKTKGGGCGLSARRRAGRSESRATPQTSTAQRCAGPACPLPPAHAPASAEPRRALVSGCALRCPKGVCVCCGIALHSKLPAVSLQATARSLLLSEDHATGCATHVLSTRTSRELHRPPSGVVARLQRQVVAPGAVARHVPQVALVVAGHKLRIPGVVPRRQCQHTLCLFPQPNGTGHLPEPALQGAPLRAGRQLLHGQAPQVGIVRARAIELVR